MDTRPFDITDLRRALAEGWVVASRTRAMSGAYAAFFTLIGAVILGLLLATGLTPFVVAAAGAFMLIGPAILAGFFGIARAAEANKPVGIHSIAAGFTAASRAIWVIALVSALLFMIFITDAAILYSFMVGRTPVWLSEFTPAIPGVTSFLIWGSLSGLGIAFMLYCVSVFSVPLLCERRTSLVNAVVASVRAVFGNFVPAMTWAILLAALLIGSILLLPLLPLTLPWLAHASRALYRQVFPEG